MTINSLRIGDRVYVVSDDTGGGEGSIVGFYRREPEDEVVVRLSSGATQVVPAGLLELARAAA